VPISRRFFTKLLLGFLVVGIFPYAWLLYFSYDESKRVVMDQIRNNLQSSIKVLIKKLESDIENIESDLQFLAHLELLDETLSSDADKQIQKLLEQKQKTLSFKGSFTLKNSSKKTIAVVQSPYENEIFLIQNEVCASFDMEKIIGKLHFKFSLKALQETLPQGDNYWIIVEQAQIRNPNQAVFFKHPLLKKYALEVYINESHHLAPLEKSQLHFMMFSLGGALILMLFAFIIGRKIVAPLEELAQVSQDISLKKDYSIRSTLKRDDEFGLLANSFNTMLTQIEQQLHELQNQSELRLSRFVRLIDLFNKLAQIKDEAALTDFYDDFLEEDFNGVSDESRTLFESAVEKMVNLQEHRITLESQQLRLLEEAKFSNEAKSRFISQISHEFRTSLNSIIGFSQYIDSENLLPQEYEKLPRNIEKAGKKLLMLINDILNLSAKEHQSFKAKESEFNIRQLLSEVVELLMPQAMKKGLLLSFVSADITIYSDKRVIEQILTNLIGNAIKYTPKGFVKIVVEQEKRSMNISVEDSGVGLTPVEINRLFEPFCRIERGSQGVEGSGLGLALVSAYAKSIDATLAVKSEGENCGSQFSIKVKI
jgi:signal transduction histidine kinase